MSSDPRRDLPSDPSVDSEPGNHESGIRTLPDRVKIPEDNPTFRYFDAMARRNDLIFAEVFAELGAARAEGRRRDLEEAKRREIREQERRETLNRIQDIAGVVRDHSRAMGDISQAMGAMARDVRSLRDEVATVREQQQSHGLELANLGVSVKRMTGHVDRAQKVDRDLDERISALENKFDVFERNFDALDSLIRADIAQRRRDHEATGKAPDAADPDGKARGSD